MNGPWIHQITCEASCSPLRLILPIWDKPKANAKRSRRIEEANYVKEAE